MGTFRCLCCPLKVLAPPPEPPHSSGGHRGCSCIKGDFLSNQDNARVCLSRVWGFFFGELSRKERAPRQLPSQKNPRASPAATREVSLLWRLFYFGVFLHARSSWVELEIWWSWVEKMWNKTSPSTWAGAAFKPEPNTNLGDPSVTWGSSSSSSSPSSPAPVPSQPSEARRTTQGVGERRREPTPRSGQGAAWLSAPKGSREVRGLGTGKEKGAGVAHQVWLCRLCFCLFWEGGGK